MLNKDTFKPLFGDWFVQIEPLFDKGIMDEIYEKLKFEGKRGVKIAPLSEFTYRAFLKTPLNSVKCVILGFCPYHTIIEKKLVADGMALSCSNHKNYIAPSLEKFYEGVSLDYQKKFDKIGDLSYLASQGVLLLNSSLTTEINKAGAHQELWSPFTSFLFENILDRWNIPVIFLGKESSVYSRYLSPMQWNFKLEHPAYAARTKEKWNTKNVFKQVNRILKDLGKKEISWIPLEEVPF